MFKKKWPILLAVSVLLITTLACRISFENFGRRTITGSGDIIIVDRPVSAFDSIVLEGVGQMHVEYGDSESLRIEAEDNIIRYIESEVRGETLIIRIKRGTNLHPTDKIKYYVTVVNLYDIDVSGAGNVKVQEIDTQDFSILISGAGDIDVDNLQVDQLDVNISGLGNLSIADGQVDQQEVSISGSGSYFAQELESRDAQISLSGLGNATVWVSDSLQVDISGAGTVNYAGDPSVQSSISGLGKINKISE